MRVAFTGDAFLNQRVGGVTRYAAELHNALRALGVDSTIEAGWHVNEHVAGLDGVRGREIPSQLVFRGSRRAVRTVNEWQQQRHLRGATDLVVHETYYRWRAATSFPTAVTVFDMTHERFPEAFAPNDPTAAMKAASVRRADVVFAISQSTRNDLLELVDVEPEKVIVTPLAASGLPPRDSIEPLIRSRPYLLYVGSRAPYKNVDRLLEVMASSPTTRELDLILFGGGPLARSESALLERLRLSARVRQISGPDELLWRCYAGARALVYPSLCEGFGIPLLEAMALACPVVCSDSSSLPEVAGEAAVLFGPGEVHDMTGAMEQIIVDDGLRSDLVIRGLRRAGEFTWERTAARTAAGYQGALSSCPR